MTSPKIPEIVHTVTIDEERVSQRLDNFLISYLKNIPKSKIYRIIRKGEVRVNKKRAGPDYKLILGDVIRIPPLKHDERKPPEASDYTLKLIKEAIIFETDNLICLNKPSGIPVHGGTGIQGGAINILRVLYKDYKFLELIHRLDRETSGCLLIAKSMQTLRVCQSDWQENKVEKYYQCLVKGHWPKSLNQIDVPLQKNVLKSGERMVQVSQDGKPARTYFKPLEYLKGATLLEVKLGTGRTHQIRVHTAHAGHPIAGDNKYGDKSFNTSMKTLGLKRLFLHACKLVLSENCGNSKELVAILPPELKAVISRLF